MVDIVDILTWWKNCLASSGGNLPLETIKSNNSPPDTYSIITNMSEGVSITSYLLMKQIIESKLITRFNRFSNCEWVQSWKFKCRNNFKFWSLEFNLQSNNMRMCTHFQNVDLSSNFLCHLHMLNFPLV